MQAWATTGTNGWWTMVDTGKRSWESSNDSYERGYQTAVANLRNNEDRYIRAFGDKLMAHMRQGLVAPVEERSTSGTWPRFMRAVEHVVTDLDPTTAATPHGIVNLGTSVATPLASVWMDDALRATRYATLIESDQPGMPTLPKMATAPTAGKQAGEKTEAYSKHFDITNDDAAATIDSTLFLNISILIDVSPGAMGILQAIMKSAVASEASAQVCQAITDAGTDATDIAGGFGSFDGGRYTPSVVVVPPSQLFAVEATTLAAAGVAVVLDPGATSVLVVDKAATVGYFKRMAAQAMEPAVSGYLVGFGIYGKVSVNPAGVAVVAAAP